MIDMVITCDRECKQIRSYRSIKTCRREKEKKRRRREGVLGLFLNG